MRYNPVRKRYGVTINSRTFHDLLMEHGIRMGVVGPGSFDGFRAFVQVLAGPITFHGIRLCNTSTYDLFHFQIL